jgi:hydroxyacylglutathione hydrolase
LSFIVHRVVTGPWKQNGFLVVAPDARTLIVDPGAEVERYREIIEAQRLKPCAILNTHAHYDHIGAVGPLMTAYAIPFYLHGADAVLLRQANLYRGLFGGKESIEVPKSFIDIASIDGVLELDGFRVRIICTPGHSKGSVCFVVGDHLFSGDTLLPNGWGRTDLPGGAADELRQSASLLRAMPSELLMHPGHGPDRILDQALAAASGRIVVE